MNHDTDTESEELENVRSLISIQVDSDDFYYLEGEVIKDCDICNYPLTKDGTCIPCTTNKSFKHNY